MITRVVDTASDSHLSDPDSGVTDADNYTVTLMNIK